MSHPADSVIYRHLWSTPETHDLFDDAGRTQAWLDILAALADAQADLGLVPAEAAAAVRGPAGPAAPDGPWITARDRVAEFATLLAMVTATLAKIGNEIYELQRPELGEISEPFTEARSAASRCRTSATRSWPSTWTPSGAWCGPTPAWPWRA